ncbi:hypothetical protein LFT48_11345 [Arthrobacter sp. FW305-123]|nr:hypothetical protein LFT48_11345 [Arthrobacter sp. FW305-123]
MEAGSGENPQRAVEQFRGRRLPFLKARTRGAGPLPKADFNLSLGSPGDESAQSLAVRANQRHQHREGSPLVPNNSWTANQVAGAVVILEAA